MLAGAVVAVLWLLHPAERLSGTDSVEPAAYVTNVAPRQRLCVRDLLVPAGADRISFALAPTPGTQVRVTMRLRTAAGLDATSVQTVTQQAEVRFPIPRSPRSHGGTACLRTTGLVAVTGHAGVPATVRPQVFLQGKPLTTGLVSVWFWDSHKRTLASVLPAAARHASVFRAGFVGPWIYLVMALLLPLLWFAWLRTLVRARA